MISKPLSTIATISAGQGAPQGKESYSEMGRPFVKAGSLEKLLITNNEYETCQLVSEDKATELRLKVFPKGTVVFPKSGMSAKLGRVYQLQNDSYVVNHLATIIGNENVVDSKYIKYYFTHNSPSTLIKDSAYPSIRLEDISNIAFPLPGLDEQRRVVKLLELASSLCQKRKLAIDLLDEYLKSTFVEMFGDPKINSKNWPSDTLINCTEIFSDGPFGSNLKTEHYQDIGVRVIRLGNIGTNEFIDDKKLFISEKHYQTIKKHTCLPGDVLIATLGDPNLRACILPDYIALAINKADCLLCRPKLSRVLSLYLCYLINEPSFLNIVSGLVHGQTRSRISSGQLKGVEIPIPPIDLQKKFSEVVLKTKIIKHKMILQSYDLEIQFQALMQKFFEDSN